MDIQSTESAPSEHSLHKEDSLIFSRFIISELQDILTNDTLSKDEKETAFQALAFSLETLNQQEFTKCFIKLGQDLGVKLQNVKILHMVCKYTEDFIRISNHQIDICDRISITLIHATSCLEIFQITSQESFLECALIGFQNIRQILRYFPELRLHLVSSHLRQHAGSSEASVIESAMHYNMMGKAFLYAYYTSKEQEHIYLAQKYLKEAVELHSTSAIFQIDYAEALITYGDRVGKTAFVQHAIKLLSSAIFCTFDKSSLSPPYTRARHLYAVALEKLFRLTYSTRYFQQAHESFKEITQENPSDTDLWLLWGSMLMSFGILHKNPSYIELGLDKLTFLKGKAINPTALTVELSIGIAILGLQLEEHRLFRESKYRIFSTLKLFPENIKLLPALGVAQLCDALYFCDDEKFATAIAYFHASLENEETVSTLERLFEAYSAWGIHKNSFDLLKKSLHIVERLCQLRPESFIFWKSRGQTLGLLAKNTLKTSYAEIFLEESIIYYSKAWKLSQEDSILESWGKALRELGAIKKQRDVYEQSLTLFLSLQKESKHLVRYTLELIETYISLAENLNDVSSAESAVLLLNSLGIDKVDDEDILLLLGRAHVCLCLKNGSHAFKIASRILSRCVKKGCFEALYPLSKLYALVGLKERAKTLFYKALENTTSSSWVQVYREDVIRIMGLDKEFPSISNNK